MALRTAIRQSPVVTFGVFVAFLWTLWTVYRVAMAFDLSAGVGDYIGYEPISGIVGLIVMIGFLALLITLYGELTEPEPAPNPWPPE